MKALRNLATVAALALTGVIAHAQSAPMMVHYQGRLTQPNGLPLTSPTASVAFEIFPSASGGTRLWPPAGPLSTYTVILRNGGIFSVMLGDTSIPGMPALTQSVFQQGIAYLQISIAGTSVGPRQPIVSVPWSIFSGQANLALNVPDEAITSKKLATDGNSLSKITGGKLRMSDGILYHRAGFTTQHEISNTFSNGTILVLRAAAFDAIVESANSYLILSGDYGIRMDGGVGIGTFPGEAALEVEGDTKVNGMATVQTLEIKQGFPFIDFGPANSDFNVRLANDVDRRLSLQYTSGGYGDIYARIFNQSSSRRWKDQVRPLSNALELVKALDGVRFQWQDDGKPDIGFVAEDVGKVLPEIVSYEKNGVDAIGMEYSRLTAVLVEGVKEQQNQIEALRQENRTLKARLEAQDRKIEAILREIRRR